MSTTTETPSRSEQLRKLFASIDQELPCAVEVCEAPAAWSIRCGACGFVELFCDLHKRFAEYHVNAGTLRPNCDSCHRRHAIPLPFLPL